MDVLHYSRTTPQNIFIIFHELELLFMNFFKSKLKFIVEATLGF
jgi:hypothetical protein